ncbi:uncharacterized protein LOC135330959 [Halichondria panicea]|uniref:uncharacterized protein LOC135330959 n=1 Tax=Halichondria panicea TaxID=6063 RepID=UPI00312B7374
MAINFFDVEGLDSHICLAGPPLSGKSSLLFQHAVTCAENGRCTVFITPQPFDRLPLLLRSSQLPLSPKTLSRIHFKYPSTLSALHELFDHAHLPGGLASHSPECVIIDDFHHYFSHLKGSGHELTTAMVKTCAHIMDGISYISACLVSAPLTQPTVCFLSTSFTSQPHMNTGIIRRWFPCLLKIVENGSKKFILEKEQNLMFSFNIQETCFKIMK